MHIMSTNFAKTLVCKHNYDVKLWCHKTAHRKQMTTICRWMNPSIKFSAYATAHALRLECEKSMELTASSHRSCFFCSSRQSRNKAVISESVPTGARRNERWRVSHSLSEHNTKFLRPPREMHCLAANSTLLQNSSYAFSMFVVSGGGNLLTDSPAWEGKSASNQPSNASPDRCGQEPWALVALWWRADVVTAGTFLEHVYPTGGCPGQHSQRPGPGWSWRFISEKRNWLLPLGRTAAKGCWMLHKSPSSHHQGKFCTARPCFLLRAKGMRKGWLGLNPPWGWYFTNTLLPLQRRLIVFAYFLFVNLSTYCKYHGINLHANFEEHCKWAKKVIIRFWWESGLSSASRNHLTTFCRPFVHYTCLRLCSAMVHFIRNFCLYFVCYGYQRKRWSHWLHYQFM